MSGEKNWDSVLKLFSAGCDAVRQVSQKKDHPIEVVLHFTNPENRNQFLSFAKSLDNASGIRLRRAGGVLQNQTGPDCPRRSRRKNVLRHWDHTNRSEIASTYDKKVMVAEVSYCYTLDDGDGSGNSVGEGANCDLAYPVSVQGQADAVRDVVNAVASFQHGVPVFLA